MPVERAMRHSSRRLSSSLRNGRASRHVDNGKVLRRPCDIMLLSRHIALWNCDEMFRNTTVRCFSLENDSPTIWSDVELLTLYHDNCNVIAAIPIPSCTQDSFFFFVYSRSDDSYCHYRTNESVIKRNQWPPRDALEINRLVWFIRDEPNTPSL